MYIFKKTDGSLVPAHPSFNPDKPDFAMLTSVDEVLVVSKVLVKQIRLVPKTKEEIVRIRKGKERNAGNNTEAGKSRKMNQHSQD